MRKSILFGLVVLSFMVTATALASHESDGRYAFIGPATSDGAKWDCAKGQWSFDGHTVCVNKPAGTTGYQIQKFDMNGNPARGCSSGFGYPLGLLKHKGVCIDVRDEGSRIKVWNYSGDNIYSSFKVTWLHA